MFEEKDKSFVVDWGTLYEKAFPAIKYYVFQNSGDEDDAKDVFQESLIALAQQSDNEEIHFRCNINTWLYSTARKIWLKKLRYNRKVYKAVEKGCSDSCYASELPSEYEFSGNHAMVMARAQVVSRYIYKMPAHHKDILVLYSRELSSQEISKVLGYSQQYVRKKVVCSKKRLLDLLRCDKQYERLFRIYELTRKKR